MATFVRVPPKRLPREVLLALLEEYTSRDGTDYGIRELTQNEKVAALNRQLDRGDVYLLYDADSEEWDLLAKEQAEMLLNS
ncbi:MAG: YheU family protein [Halioglobus sp.]|nr:YheU family protein [Halioglobus sp.]